MTVASYFLPRSTTEALDLLAKHGPALLVVAGGTLAMPLINEGISLPELVMGLRRAGLDGLERSEGTLRIGATATLSQLAVQEAVPILRDAARSSASPSIRNMATVGGNVFTPPPGGDVAVALLALDATVTLAGRSGERDLPLADFFTGFLTNRLAEDELLVEIRVPVRSDPAAYVKFGRKHANTPAVVTVATRVTWAADRIADARIALGAVGPHPIRAWAAERLLIGTSLDPETIASAAAAAADECEPFTDAIATAWYRRRMTRLFVGRALAGLADGPRSGGRP
ncbi:MAG: FAD binding domain-containing protein [Candidatus Limnocylindrales bacterium]